MAEDIQETTDQSVNTGDGVQESTEQVKTFTQEEVNGLVTKESRKAQEKIFKSLGFEDIESAKEGFEQLKAWQDSQKSEAEKQSEALVNKDKELDTVRAENKALSAKLSALSLGVNAESVEDVIALSERKVSDDVSMEDAIKEVLQKYPQFGAQVPEPAEEKKPSFSVGGNPAVNDAGNADPFKAIMQSYGK